jgi:hypothetical protein
VSERVARGAHAGWRCAEESEWSHAEGTACGEAEGRKLAESENARSRVWECGVVPRCESVCNVHNEVNLMHDVRVVTN